MLFELTPLDVGKADLCLINISIEIDFAMALMIRFDGKPGTELVSLIHGPQAELDRTVDEYVAGHRYELTHRLKKCPRCGYDVFRDQAPASCPEGCGLLVDVKNLDVSEDHIRQDAKSQLAGPGLLASRHANLCWRIVTENLKVSFSSQEDVGLSLDETLQILRARMQESIVTLAAIATKANDAVFLGGRTDLLPQGATLNEKHADYLYVRSKLEVLGTWLSGLEYNHPEFVDFPPEYPLTPYRFSLSVELPVVSGAQAKEPVADQDTTAPAVATGTTGNETTVTARSPRDADAEDQQDSEGSAGEDGATPGGQDESIQEAETGQGADAENDVDHHKSWEPPNGYVRVSTIMSDERFQKKGKNPLRSSIQRWEEKEPPAKIERDPASNENCYAEEWVMRRLKEWNPQLPKTQ